MPHLVRSAPARRPRPATPGWPPWDGLPASDTAQRSTPGPCRDSRPGGPLRSEDQTVTSSPANRTALREEENRPAPPSQQVIASPVTGPAPYSRSASTLAPDRLRAAASSQQPVPQHVQAGLQPGKHVQGGSHL